MEKCAKRQKLEDDEDLELECEKLTFQVTELARKNRLYIEKAEKYKTRMTKAIEIAENLCHIEGSKVAEQLREMKQKIEFLETDLKHEKQLNDEKNQTLDSEVRDFETLLAEITDKLFHEKSENDRLRKEMKTETEQRKAMQMKVTSLETKLGKEYNRQYIKRLSSDRDITSTKIYLESRMENDLLKDEIKEETELRKEMQWRIEWLETELQQEKQQVRIYQIEANLKGFGALVL